jgi:hypothetical protein
VVPEGVASPTGRAHHRAGVRQMTREATAVGVAEWPAATAARKVVVGIGINRYEAWPHLGNAVNDVRKTCELFEHLGFENTTMLLDDAATYDALRRLVTDDLCTLGVHDSLVLCFAGHGATTTTVLQDGTKVQTGFILPANAENHDGQVASWLRLDTWLDDIARLPANHILVILDACHSGIALESLIRGRDVITVRGNPPDALSMRRSRKVIASALGDQIAQDGGPVPGHSLFTGCLIEALTGGLASDGRTTTTGSELGFYLQRKVKAYPNSRQTPDFGGFELDDRGELLIPLQSSAAAVMQRRPPASPVDVTAGPRRQLALALAEAHPVRDEILNLVAEHGLQVEIAELPATTALAIWMQIVLDLSNRDALRSLRPIAEAARTRVKGSARAALETLLRTLPASSTVHPVEWSHIDLDLRWHKAEVADPILLSDHAALLEAVVTQEWGGPPPADPLIEVSSSRLFGATTPLLHEVTVLDRAQGIARWKVKIPVPRSRLRTRRISVRCVDTDVARRAYLVSVAGWIATAAIGFAFAAFTCFWLLPISPLLLTAPLSVLGVASGSWSLIRTRLVRSSGKLPWLQGLFSIWERALVPAVLTAALVVILPPHLAVIVDNTTNSALQLANGTVIAKEDQHRVMLAGSGGGWNVKPPFCRCHTTERCQCGAAMASNPRWVDRIAFGCLDGDCASISEPITRGGSGTIVRPVDAALSSILIDQGAGGERMELSASRTKVVVKNLRQTGVLELAIVPDAQSFTIDFASSGTLTCHAGARRVLALPFKRRASDPATIDVQIHDTPSSWKWHDGSDDHPRACTSRPSGAPANVRLTIGKESVACRGGPVDRVVPIAVAPAVLRFGIGFGSLHTEWVSTEPQETVRVCLGAPGDVQLDGLAAGHRVSLPADPPTLQVVIRRPQGQRSNRTVLQCNGGSVVRAVKLVGTDAQESFSVAHATIGRLDDTTGVTCSEPAQASSGNRICVLDEATLTCITAYRGDCRLLTSGGVEAGGSTKECPVEATHADAERARRDGRSRGLTCTRVFQCE